MTDIEARTADAAEPVAAPTKPKVYGEWDGYSTPLPVTAHSVASAQEPVKSLPSKTNPAEWMFDRLVRMIDDFEKNLSDQEEIGGRMVGAPGEGSFHIDDIGFWGPDLIMFYGKNRDGRPVRLIQHYTQLSVLLTSMPKEKEKEKPRRIGFVIRERQETEEAAAPPAEAPALPALAEAEVEAHPS
jgi:hypothetical protein